MLRSLIFLGALPLALLAPTEPARTIQSSQPAADKATPRVDLYGDALPDGALARLGTIRLVGQRCRFLPDSRRLVRERADYALQISEIPSGKPLALIHANSIPKATAIMGSTIGCTPDGKYLAAVPWEEGCGIWETATGRLVRRLEGPHFYSVVKCDFSPDGKLLAVGAPNAAGHQIPSAITVEVYDWESGKRLFAVPGTNSAFAPDGRSIVVWQGYSGEETYVARRIAIPSGQELVNFRHQTPVGGDGTPPTDGIWFFDVGEDHTIRAWDIASGQVKHRFTGPKIDENWTVRVRHALGHRELIALGLKPGELWCWDLETGTELWHRPLAAPTHYVELSRDGKTLVTSDDAGNVEVCDPATGAVRTSFRPAQLGQGRAIVLSPDGKTVASGTSNGIGSTTVAFWDVATGKLLAEPSGHAAGISAAIFGVEGARLYTFGADQTLRSWDALTGKQLARVEVESTYYLAAGPDANAFYAAGKDGGNIRVLDPRTARVERTLPTFAKSIVGLAVTADGKRLIAAGRDTEVEKDYLVRCFDPATGAKLGEFGGSEGKIEQLAVSENGQVIATSHQARNVVLWDAQGRNLLEQTGRGQRCGTGLGGYAPYAIGSIGLSRDGCWLAFSDQEQGVAIIDTRLRREIGRAKLDVYYQLGSARSELQDVLTFSPDGKTIAWSGVESTADIFLIDRVTCQVRRRLHGDSFPVKRLAFSPDGSKLLSAGPDGSALIWDVFGRAVAKPALDQIAGAVDLLGDANAGKAYDAMCQLIAAPEPAVTLLGARLKPAPSVEERYRQMLKDLDSDQFAARTTASQEMERLGDGALPLIRQTLAAQPTLEARRRLEAIQAKLEGPVTAPELLQSLRAIEVLEHIGTMDAKQLLTKLAEGAPGAIATQEAKATLNRLSRR